ncbi:restriction endonuclease subunit S [Fusobacterium canifelinum]|uniref:Restriction endonuclease subunit S n=2 Tax=Fusobacterium canifelinum TaxID=285729 RepID=A0A7T4KGF0_9FUSO|nr:restriction endonuclease subunit S [Fusobacterium canifelinum]QQB73931.1 restriction endonuclease subunit S [Fusobacterium canifelinum]
MSKLDELIKELCPNGVEYKELGEIVKSQRGKTITKELIKDGDIPVISGGQRPAYYHNESNRKGEVITVAGSGAYAGFVMYWDKPIFVSDAFSIECDKSYLNIKYIYYFLQNNQMKIYSLKKGGGVPHVYFKDMQKFLVPVPPLEVQDEIVKILDDYTKFLEELKEKINKELVARKKQYSWYRDYLLKFENKVKMVKIGDLFEFKNGINKDKGSFGKGTPIINYVNVYKKNKIYFEDLKGLVEASNDELVRYGVKRGDVFFTRTSETVEEIGYTSVLLEDIENCVFSGFLLRARPITDLLLPEYCAYCFSTSNIRNTIIKKSTYTTRALTNGTSLSQIEIPLPPLKVQKRIVEVLDNFEKICNDLNIGLPAEIEARQKQYEFYRNFLLTFKIENCTLPKTRQDKTRQDIIKLFMYIFGYIELELGEILKIKNGSDYKKFNIGNIPVYGSGGIINYIDTYIYDKESVLIPRKGSIGNLFYVDKPFWTVDTIFYTVIDKDIVIPKYVYYYLSKVNLEKLNTAGGVPSLTQTVLNKILIPLPSLEEQQRIVDILDRFDKLCNDISEGLPAEIEARQKQYEYFREKLLTFKNIND